MNGLARTLGVELPLIQAPMAGVGTPELAAAVSNAGALGSIGVGPLEAEAARSFIRRTRELTARPFNVNLFCNAPAVPDEAREAAWLAALKPFFDRFGTRPPAALRELYRSFLANEAMLEMLLEERPRVISFHFGLPPPETIERLRKAGVFLMATATSLDEARAIALAGLGAVVAQGIEAGGHRGVFDPDGPDEKLSTRALIESLIGRIDLPIVAAGGLMDGKAVAGALALGAQAAQLGTAFIACPESAAAADYRRLLLGGAAKTVLSRAISGRPARGFVNRLTVWGESGTAPAVPDYPLPYQAAKELEGAAKSAGDFDFSVRWAGAAAALSRALPAGELVALLAGEMNEALEAGFDS